MKNWLLISLIFLVSCSHNSHDRKREIASGFPARIVKIISPTISEVEFKENLELQIKVVAFKFGTAVAKGRKVKFSIEKGDISVKNKSEYTDSNGNAQATIVVNEYPTEIHLKVRIDNVIKNIQVQVTRPAKYTGTYSETHSQLLVDKSSVLGSGKEKVNFQLQFKDSQAKSIDAYGLDVKLIKHDGSKVSMSEKSKGLYEKIVLMNLGKGDYQFGIEVEGKKLSTEVVINIVPDIVIVERFLLTEKTKDGQYLLQFAAKERVGGFIQSLDGLNLKPVLNGPGKYSKISYNKEKYRFEYTFYPPAKTGNTVAGVSYNGKSHWAKKSFEYEYSPVDASRIKLSIKKKKLVPTGIDFVPISVEYRDEANQLIKIENKSQFPEFEVTPTGRVLALKQDDKGVFHGKLQPASGQKDLQISLKYEGRIIDEQELKFDFKPVKEKLSLERHIGSGTYFNGLNFQVQNRGEDWKNITGTVSQFNLENSGGNDIVPNGCAKDSDSNECQATREYEWEFSEQAKQNMVMIVTDFPSDTLSKMMHGWFFFFPRVVIPSIRWSEDKSQLIVTLPTDEEVIFDAKTKRIVGGVLEEGPIDLGPSRHTRRFPLVRYKGKGVVLRINARGQDARLGNWNRTKISGDFGDTGAEGVMIYKFNSSTGEPDVCRAAKKDFWPQEDINPIPFKYFSDIDFAAYLKSHCDFNLSLD